MVVEYLPLELSFCTWPSQVGPRKMPSDSANSDEEKTGVSVMLDDAYIGTFNVPLSKLRLTTTGRPLREAGVQKMMQSIKEDGWLTSSMPIVVVLNNEDGQNITAANACTIYYGVLDGNHRVEALLRRDRAFEEAHNDEGLTRDTTIAVRVHPTAGSGRTRSASSQIVSNKPT